MTVYGTAELAKAAGVTPRTLSAYLARGKCPAPSFRLDCGPVWTQEDVGQWLTARDARLERIIETADEKYRREQDALAEALYQSHYKDKRETAKRNVHNGRLAKYRARTGLENGTLRGQGIVPTLRAESLSRAARMLGDETFQTSDPRFHERMRVRDWAAGMLQRRQAVRVGDPDGIPW